MLNILKYPRFLSKMVKTNSPLVCPLCFFVIFAVLGFLCHHCCSLHKGLVHFADPQSIDYPNGLSNGLPRWTTHMDYLINYPRKRKERKFTPSLFVLIDSSPIRHLVFISITAAQITCRIETMVFWSCLN